MKYAFDAAGFDEMIFQLEAIADNWLKAGGTIERWIATVHAVAQRSGSGQHKIVQQDHLEHAAPASEPMPGAGHIAGVQQDQIGDADARQPLAGGEGQPPHVQQDQRVIAFPAREPDSPIPDGGQQWPAQQGHVSSASVRNPAPSPGIGAASGSGHGGSVQQDRDRTAAPARVPSAADWNRRINRHTGIAMTIMETIKVPDGRGIGKVRLSETTRIASGSVQMASLLLKIRDHASAAPHFKGDPLIEEAISERLLEKLVAEVKRESENPQVNTHDRGVLIAPNGRVSVVKVA